MHLQRPAGTSDVAVLVCGIVVVALTAAVLRLIPNVAPTTVALAFLLVVMGAATLARFRVALVVCLAATLTLNFFFLPPVGRLTIAEPQNWVALFAFTTVAATVAGVVAIAVERAQFFGEREAAEVERQRADLAATVLASLSHDLRTPITAIRIAVENLRGDLCRQEREAQIAAAATEINRLSRLVQDILDMTRIDAAAIRLDRQWVTPADVVDAAMAHVRHALKDAEMHVDAAADSEIEIDPRLASVALSHLLENAAQYGRPAAGIVVRAWINREGLNASVTDHGPGLDPGELEHVFERFYRGRAGRHVASGTGMGLAISQGLLTASGGRIRAENVPGGGARFTMTVPGEVRAAALGLET